MIQQRIAIGVVENSQKKILVSKRKMGTHLEGCWELPGGKVALKESFKMALRRELSEELDIQVNSTSKLIELKHQYDDRQLHFQVFNVNGYSGVVRSVEHQELQWVDYSQFSSLDFPAANRAILDAISLPRSYMIADQDVLKNQLTSIVRYQLESGISLVQYRANNVSKQTYIANAKQLREMCMQFEAKFITNCELDWVAEINPNGIHLNSARLYEVCKNLSTHNGMEFFSASCHNAEEVDMANTLGVRSVLIGSVNKTHSHVDASTLGWPQFGRLCFMANSPVYALGGMSVNDYENAKVHGAQGIAAIRAFLN
ncbi:MAG: Nudix family hydrolase [Gammaproteobacteria bacterium]|nr:Nudix family hydrolase [Gammaproteobacteria bacterium]